MLTEALMALGAASGTAVVGAMATDAWKATRDHVARLFARGGAGRRKAIEAALDEDADILTDAEETEREQVRRELVVVWRRRMVRLLEHYPDAAGDVQELISRVHAALPPAQQAWVQHNTAAAGGTIIAHQGSGGQYIYYDQPPGSATEEDSSVSWSGEGR